MYFVFEWPNAGCQLSGKDAKQRTDNLAWASCSLFATAAYFSDRWLSWLKKATLLCPRDMLTMNDLKNLEAAWKKLDKVPYAAAANMAYEPSSHIFEHCWHYNRKPWFPTKTQKNCHLFLQWISCFPHSPNIAEPVQDPRLKDHKELHVAVPQQAGSFAKCTLGDRSIVAGWVLHLQCPSIPDTWMVLIFQSLLYYTVLPWNLTWKKSACVMLVNWYL